MKRPFTCLWWRTCQCWRLQNFLVSFVPPHINLQVDHPLEWAACILGMKAEGQSDLSYSSGSENLWESRRNGDVKICVQHASLSFFWWCSLISAIVSNSCFAGPCWCCIQYRRMKYCEKEILFQGKAQGLNLNESLSLESSIPYYFLLDFFFITLSQFILCPSAVNSSLLYFRPWPCLQRLEHTI